MSSNNFVTGVAVAALSLSIYGCSTDSNELSLSGIDMATVESDEVDAAGEAAGADAKTVGTAREAAAQRVAAALAAGTAAEQTRMAAKSARDEADRLRIAAESVEEPTVSPTVDSLHHAAEAAADQANAAVERERKILSAQKLAGLDGGLAASPASPVYAAREEDTLASLLPGGEVIFAPLSAALILDYHGSNRGVREPGSGAAYAKSVASDGAGGFRVSYSIDGIETLVHFGASQYYGNPYWSFFDAETTEQSDYWFWSATDSFAANSSNSSEIDRTDGSSMLTYFDVNGWNDVDGGINIRGYSAYGVRTRPENLPLGRATFEGKMRGDVWDKNHFWDTQNQKTVIGTVTLEANLDEKEISGQISEIKQKGFGSDGDYEPLAHGNSIAISSITIEEGRFTAGWVGNNLDLNAVLTESIGGFEGTMLGEFYGPTAEEVGGVLSGRRDATSSTPEQYLIGGFGAAISEDGRGATPGASGVALAIDLAANTGKIENDEHIGSRTHHFDRYPVSGLQHVSVSQSHRDGSGAAAIPWRGKHGELEFRIDVVPHGEPLQRDPDIWPGRYISTSDAIARRDGSLTTVRPVEDHAFGEWWQAFEAKQRYDAVRER